MGLFCDDAPRQGDLAPCVAGILAGGRSVRMGRDKGLLSGPDGRTLIEHVVGVVTPIAGEVVMLGHGFELPANLSHLSVLTDDRPDAGPLAGLSSLLSHAGGRWALLLSCDLPLVDEDLLFRLLRGCGDDCDAVAYPRLDDPAVWHACCAAYHPRLLPIVRDELDRGIGSIQAVLRRSRTRRLHVEASVERRLCNVNTPEDYAALSK